jgi:hypothetical protein
VVDVPFDISVTVIVTFGIAAPEVSVTVPKMDPYTACADAAELHPQRARNIVVR